MLAKFGLSTALFKSFTGSVNATFTSRRATLSGSSVPSYVRLDSTLLARQLTKNLRFSASVYNITGRRYWDPASDAQAQDRLFQDGRTWRVNLTYHFGEK
jgi:outer membrane receptor protein involved in Fe transport